MKECKSIIFIEDPNDPGPDKLLEISRQWYELNKDNVSNLHGIFGVVKDKDDPSIHKVALILHYDGEGGLNPADCPHDNQYTNIVDPSRCDHAGTSHIICGDCNMLLKITHSEPLQHQYEFIPNNDETCLKDGTLTGTCMFCGNVISKPNPGTALGHSYEWSTETEETCITDRIEIGICSRCNDTTHRTIENTSLGHDYVYASDNNATCTEDGTQTGVCIRCGNKDTIVEPNTALGHEYTYVSNKDATCLDNGTQTGVCIRCGHQIVIPEHNTVLGHELPSEWTVRLQPTWQYEGIKFKKCVRCDYEITESIPMLVHEWISNNDGTHSCITEGGCNTTENCYPIGLGEVCEKCGYTTPQIITENIDDMIMNGEFSQQLESNVDSDFTWSIIDGELPDGITFTEDGKLSGIPTESGVYTFTVQLEHKGYSAIKEYIVNVSEKIYTITFDPMDGVASKTSRQISQGTMIGELPTASRDGYIFGGWFTAESGGLKVDEMYSVASDITLYARWGKSEDDMIFGDATSTFNIQYNDDRTNYNNEPYTFYNRYSDGTESDLVIQTAISSEGNSNNMTDENPIVKLYMKVTNNRDAGNFDIGFDCDSYVENDDCLYITRLENGVNLNDHFEVTVPYDTSIWMGKYNARVENRYQNVEVGTRVGKPGDRAGGSNDTGYAFTMKDIFINSNSYTILEVTFKKL